jgi:hypothetical protein
MAGEGNMADKTYLSTQGKEVGRRDLLICVYNNSASPCKHWSPPCDRDEPGLESDRTDIENGPKRVWLEWSPGMARGGDPACLEGNLSLRWGLTTGLREAAVGPRGMEHSPTRFAQ